MCAPSTSASAMKMTRWYRAASRSNARAGAGPDDLDDRRALGVLEHVGERRLLHVEDLAADRQQRLELGVPRQLGGAERRVALDDEQLAAVVGGTAVDQLGRQRRAGQRGLAALVLPVLARGDPGLRGRDDLLQHGPRLLLAGPAAGLEEGLQLAATTWATIRDAAGVPSTSLVCPSNWGSGSRTVTIAVMPSSTSSLVTGSSPFFSSRAARSCSFIVRTSARSKPDTCVPPCGVAITLTNDRVTVS